MSKRMTTKEDRAAFFARIHKFSRPDRRGALLIGKAYRESKEAFRKVRRKGGERYFEHCRAVALILMDDLGVRDPELVAAALLHDIVEDCHQDWPIERVRKEFGGRVMRIVEAVTIPCGDFPDREARMDAYHARLFRGPREALLLKLADRLHNLRTCAALLPDARKRMVRETEALYLPFAKSQGVLYAELSEAIITAKATPEYPSERDTVIRPGYWVSRYADAHGWFASSHKDKE